MFLICQIASDQKPILTKTGRALLMAKIGEVLMLSSSRKTNQLESGRKATLFLFGVFYWYKS
jgi:uncharacterized protein YhhL (DUF1145 family)